MFTTVWGLLAFVVMVFALAAAGAYINHRWDQRYVRRRTQMDRPTLADEVFATDVPDTPEGHFAAWERELATTHH